MLRLQSLPKLPGREDRQALHTTQGQKLLIAGYQHFCLTLNGRPQDAKIILVPQFDLRKNDRIDL